MKKLISLFSAFVMLLSCTVLPTAFAEAVTACDTVKVSSESVNEALYAELSTSSFEEGVSDTSASESTEAPVVPEFTTAPHPLTKRGVEQPIADIDIAVNKDMQFEDGDVVAVIGDSITNSNFYVSFLSEIYAAKSPMKKLNFIIWV